MNVLEDIKKAEKLFAEYKEGDEFERRSLYSHEDDWETIDADQVVGSFASDHKIRLKPKPVRRLKRASVILDEAFERGAVVYHDQGHKIMIVTGGKLVSLGWLHKNQLRTYNELPGTFGDISSWGDWMFEPVETPTTPSTDRIEEMANAVSDRWLYHEEETLLATIIREECTRRNIT